MREDDLSFAGIDFDLSDDSNFLFSISSIYPEVNLLAAIVKIEKSGIAYHKVPIDSAKGTGSYSRRFHKDWEANLITLRFSPTAREWFSESGFQPKIMRFWKDMKSLRDRLKEDYTLDKSSAANKFSRFTN